MYGRAMGIGRSVVPQLNLKGRRKLLDIGGGPAAYSTLIAQTNPEITCTVLDLPAVAAVAAELVRQAGMSERVKILPGDYHITSFPAGNDAVIIFGVLHQESPESIQDIFRRAFEALTPGGVIYVLDMMTDSSHTSPPFSALFGLNMALTTLNGWVFSDEELRGWMQEAGFVGFEVRPLPPPMPHWLAIASRP
jgi:cyclopropane fatty-acyl-phospholipid synthase-like methyltransferase